MYTALLLSQCYSYSNNSLCTSPFFAEIIPAVFNEGNEEERLDNLFEVGEGSAPTAVVSDTESVVLSLARKCLRCHMNVEWGMLLCCAMHVSVLV